MAAWDVQTDADDWGVSVQQAQEYLEHVWGAGKHFATAVAFPYENAALVVFDGVFARDRVDAPSIAVWSLFKAYSVPEGGMGSPSVGFCIPLPVREEYACLRFLLVFAFLVSLHPPS